MAEEDKALAILYLNLTKRKRTVDPITVAESVRRLVELHGSSAKVAEMVGVSDSTIQIWLKIAHLPREFKQYILDGRIKPVAAYRIASAFKVSGEQLEVARALLDWPENEIAMVIRYKKRNPSKSIEECKQFVIEEAKRDLVTRSLKELS